MDEISQKETKYEESNRVENSKKSLGFVNSYGLLKIKKFFCDECENFRLCTGTFYNDDDEFHLENGTRFIGNFKSKEYTGPCSICAIMDDQYLITDFYDTDEQENDQEIHDSLYGDYYHLVHHYKTLN